MNGFVKHSWSALKNKVGVLIFKWPPSSWNCEARNPSYLEIYRCIAGDLRACALTNSRVKLDMFNINKQVMGVGGGRGSAASTESSMFTILPNSSGFPGVNSTEAESISLVPEWFPSLWLDGNFRVGSRRDVWQQAHNYIVYHIKENANNTFVCLCLSLPALKQEVSGKVKCPPLARYDRAKGNDGFVGNALRVKPLRCDRGLITNNITS